MWTVARKRTVYRDAEGNPTESPADAVEGEIVEEGFGDAAPRRMWFRVEDVQLERLRLSETAFLLWVLAGLVFAWLVVALLLLLL
jgi:hypothetical protein